MTAALEFLTCPSCGAPTPLVDSGFTQCVYCASRIAVPPSLGAPIRQFRDELAKMRQNAFEPYPNPTNLVSNVIATLMGAVIAVFLIWWWRVFTQSARSLDGKTAIVIADLAALPVIFFLFAAHSASGERHYFRSAKLTFASLRFDLPGPGGALLAGLTCRHCGAPVEYRQARDIVIQCGHCQTQLLIPSVLLSDQLQGMFKTVMSLHGKAFDHYQVRKWLLIGLIAFNGVFPMVVMYGTEDPLAGSLVWLTTFAWMFMLDWVFAIFCLKQYGPLYGWVVFFVMLPGPFCFLYASAGELLRASQLGFSR